MIFLRQFIFIVALLASGSVYAVNTCQGIFRSSGPLVDGRYGRESQYIEGLGPLLCGPTCIWNGLNKFHANGSVDIAQMARKTFPLIGANVVKTGARTDHVAGVLRLRLAHEGLQADVSEYSAAESPRHSAGRPSLALMRESIHDDVIVIAKLGFYRSSIDRASLHSRTGGHYVLIAGYDPAMASQFYIVDPKTPRQLRIIDLMEVWPESFPSSSFAVHFEDGNLSAPTALIEDLIVVRRKP